MIVNPWLFYLMSICSSANVIGIIIMILSCVAAIVIGVTLTAVFMDDEPEMVAKLSVVFKYLILTFAISTFVVLLAPSEDTLLMMQAAKLATTDNVNMIFDALKQAIDYVAQILS